MRRKARTTSTALAWRNGTTIQRLQEESGERALQDYDAGRRPRCLQDYELDLNRHPEQVAWHGGDLHDADHHGLWTSRRFSTRLEDKS